LSHRLQSTIGLVSLLLHKSQNASGQRKIPLLAWSPQGMLVEERNDILDQLLAVPHFKPIAEAVIRPAIALDVNITASKEFAQFVEDDPILRPKFQAEARVDFGSTALRVIELDSETSFAID
jgi:hypothetical protein